MVCMSVESHGNNTKERRVFFLSLLSEQAKTEQQMECSNLSHLKHLPSQSVYECQLAPMKKENNLKTYIRINYPTKP